MKKDAAFDWFQLDRNTLFDILYQTHDKIVNQQLTPEQVQRKFKNQIIQYIPVRFKKLYFLCEAALNSSIACV